jgi:hypothetical protein
MKIMDCRHRSGLICAASAVTIAANCWGQSYAPVRSFASDEASGWPVANMKFIGNRLALGLVTDGPAGTVRFLDPTLSGLQFASDALVPPDSECRDFGLSIAVDGTRFAVGSSTGHVYVYDIATGAPTLLAAWRASPSGYALIHSLSSDQLLVGLPAANNGQGGGALLQIKGDTMTVTQHLIPELPAGKLGWSGGISGDSIVLSAEEYWGNWHAMTWRRQANGAWEFETELLPANPADGSIFGCSSAIEGDVIAVGARDDGAAGPASGACYVFERMNNQWIQTARLSVTEPPFGNQETGSGVAVRDGRIWISAGGSMENGTGDRGRLLIAERRAGAWSVTQTLRSAETGNPTFWGYGVTFGPAGSVAAFGFDSPAPYSTWRLKCDLFAAPADCDEDSTHDLWQVWSGASTDANADGIPDDCQTPSCRDADFFPDRNVNGADLGILLSQWGPATQYTVADLNRDGTVDGADLGVFLSFWGPCPY